jgi:hypothetical protein
MSIGLSVRLAFWLFAAIVIVGAAGFLVIDVMDKVESLKAKAPWIPKILERRDAFVALLLICLVVLIGDGYELLRKEIPEVCGPLNVTFQSPPAPRITINQIARPVKDQCWVKNYAVPPVPPPPSWGLATVICNTTIKPPYSIELDYDQSVAIGPFTFPVGSEFTKSYITNEDTKVVAVFDLHTIIPNEPFSIMAKGSTDKFPLVKAGTIRAKNRVFDFHP